MSSTLFENPRLLADVGGTYARFTLETGPGIFEHAASLRCADYEDFHATVQAYLSALPARTTSPPFLVPQRAIWR